MEALRLTRADGSMVFGPRVRSVERLRQLRTEADRIGDPGPHAVLDRWLPRSGADGLAPPPLPAGALADRPLAVLRPDWTARGDLVAVDHRRRGDRARVEVAGRGQTWLGPTWQTDPAPARFGRPQPSAWVTGAFADGFEWTYRTDLGRVARMAVLLRGRGLAILAEQRRGPVDGGEPAFTRFDLPAGLVASRAAGSPVWTLSAGPGRPGARLFSPLDAPQDRPTPGSPPVVEVADGSVRLRPAVAGSARRAWLPLVLSWGKPPTTWRGLTVTEKSRTCPPHVAVAYRLAWGPRDEGLLIYRSLAPARLRAVLGHQTRARFLVGGFTRTGDVRPLLRFD